MGRGDDFGAGDLKGRSTEEERRHDFDLVHLDRELYERELVHMNLRELNFEHALVQWELTQQWCQAENYYCDV